MDIVASIDSKKFKCFIIIWKSVPRNEPTVKCFTVQGNFDQKHKVGRELNWSDWIELIDRPFILSLGSFSQSDDAGFNDAVFSLRHNEL